VGFSDNFACIAVVVRPLLMGMPILSSSSGEPFKNPNFRRLTGVYRGSAGTKDKIGLVLRLPFSARGLPCQSFQLAV
jgi:hypothetical protein